MADTTMNKLEMEEAAPDLFRLILKKMWQLRLGMVGIVLIVALIITALFCPFIAPGQPYEQDIMQRLQPPSWMKGGTPEHLLGTDAALATADASALRALYGLPPQGSDSRLYAKCTGRTEWPLGRAREGWPSG